MRRFTIAVLLVIPALGGCGAQQPAPPPPPDQFQRASPDLVAHGKRVATVLGCVGCHGSNLQGLDWSEPGFARLWTANLTRSAPAYPGPALEAVIRSGTRPDGSELWGMPSFTFTHLTPDDMAAVIAFLRAQPVGGPTHPRPIFEAQARKEIATGIWKSSRTEVREQGQTWPPDAGSAHALGRYLARATCAECHGIDLRGSTPYPGAKPRPDLAMVAAYPRAEFRKLLRTGKAMGGRELELMSEVARGRYAQFTDGEIDALHAYLTATATPRQP